MCGCLLGVVLSVSCCLILVGLVFVGGFGFSIEEFVGVFWFGV